MIKLEQKEFYYTYSSSNKPTLRVRSGETIVASFPDFCEGAIKKEGDRLPFELFEAHWNPTVGPIYVEGAEKGDTLRISIMDIHIDSDHGVAVLLPPFDDFTCALMKPPDYQIKICPIESGSVSFGDGIRVPVTPSVGCIGTAPLYGAVPTADVGRHGGNMDVPDIRKGTTVYLPVFARGALMGIGDVHAWQPAGELSAVDVPATVTFSLELMKGKRINWPRIESKDYLTSINTNVPIEKAIQTGLGEMILWLSEYGIEAWDAWEKIAEICQFEMSKFSPTVVSAKYPRGTEGALTGRGKK